MVFCKPDNVYIVDSQSVKLLSNALGADVKTYQLFKYVM